MPRPVAPAHLPPAQGEDGWVKTRMQDSNASEETSGWQGFKHLSEVNERTEDEARHADG